MNETEIIQKLSGGDVTALEEVYRAYADQLYAFSLSICKSKTIAEDVTADIFIMLYTYLSSGKTIHHLKSFLYTCARNKTYDVLKSASRHESLPEDSLLVCEETDTTEKISAAHGLAKLSAEEREIVTLYCISGFLHREIAQILGLPEGTVRWKYRSALSKLKMWMEG